MTAPASAQPGRRSEPAAESPEGCFHDYANSGLNFYFEATVESVFVEQESDWSNNTILTIQN